MKLPIYDNETIGELRTKFSAQFPFLRIDLFRPLADDIQMSALRVADDSVTLGDLRRSHQSGTMGILGTEITGQVEKRFEAEYGLHVQIFRRSGTLWILTTKTDNLTLNRQNELGEEMMTSVELPEPEDIHERE